MICAPTLRQSNELLAKVKAFTGALPTGLRSDGHNRVSMVLPNNSRIVAIPANLDTTRGFSSVSMMLIDEAPRVPDPAFHALTPMLARSNGNLWVMSTPRGRLGFFHDTWHNGGDYSDWFRVFNTIDDCPNIPRDFVERERRDKPAADFLEDYYCVFQDSTEQLFSTDDMDAASGTMSSRCLRPTRAYTAPRDFITASASTSASVATTPPWRSLNATPSTPATSTSPAQHGPTGPRSNSGTWR